MRTGNKHKGNAELIIGIIGRRRLNAAYQWGWIFGIIMLICTTVIFAQDTGFIISAGTFSLTNYCVFDVSGSIIIQSGANATIEIDNGQIYLTGSWQNLRSPEAFICGTSTVTFYNVLSSTISGNTTFYSFICETGGKQIYFGSGSTQTVINKFLIYGEENNLIKLRSTIDGEKWYIKVSTSQHIYLADVKDSDALGDVIYCENGVNSGNNNDNWIFIFDQGPPAAISDLVAQQGIEYDGDVILVWTAPGDDGMSGEIVNGEVSIKVATYNITADLYDSIIHNPPFSYSVTFSTSYNTQGSSHTYVFRGLNPGTTYYFAIKIRDEVGNWSSWSTEGVNNNNFSSALDLPPLPVVSLSALSNSSHTVNLSWEKYIPLYIDDINKYLIYRATFNFISTTVANVILIAEVNHPSEVYLDSGLTTNVTYYYRIITLDKGDQGNGLFSEVLYSALSIPSSACPLPIDPAKVKVSVVWDNRSSTNMNNYGIVDGIEDADGTVTWEWPFIPDGGTIVNYFIEVSTDKNFSFFISSATLPPNVSTYTVSNLPRGYYVYARVRAKNDEGIIGDWTYSDGIYINLITVNGDNTDWPQNYTTVVNSVTVSRGVALWRDAISDQRTDRENSSQLDISSFAITCDEYNLYIFCAFASTVPAGFDGRNYIQILIDNDNLSTERVFRGRGDRYEDSYVSKYVPWEYICEIVTGNDQVRVEDYLWRNRKYGRYTENNDHYYYEVAIPLSYLGGKEKFLGKTVNFTIATFWNGGGPDGSIGDWSTATNSNIVDVITSTGPNTWNEVYDRIVDFYLAVSFASTGSVVSAEGVMTYGSTIPDEPEPPVDGIPPAPPSALDYILYNIFIDAWYNGDPTNDDIADLNDYGGDFQGVIDKVDYLNELGINVAYFAPPWEFGGGIWGFNTDDPFRFETKFGGTEKYIEMVKVLHNHNIKVMNDWVCGQVGSRNSPAALRHPDFYQDEEFGWGTKQQFAEPRAYYMNHIIWAVATCDAIRYDNPKFWNTKTESGIGPQAYDFNRVFRIILDRWSPQTYVMGEIPEEVSTYNLYTGNRGPMLHGALCMRSGGYKNNRNSHICSWVRPGTDAQSTLTASEGIKNQQVNWKNEWSINPIMMENHDECRFASRGRALPENTPWHQQLGYMTAITIAGPVDIMYGGEVCLEGPYDGWQEKEKMGVNGNVRLMPFERASQFPYSAVRSSIIRAIQAKANFPALRSDPKKGGWDWPSFTPDPYGDDVMVYLRKWGSGEGTQYVLCAMNRSNYNRTISNVNVGVPNRRWKDWLTDTSDYYTDSNGYLNKSGNYSITVNSHYGLILVAGPNATTSPYEWCNVTGTVVNHLGEPVAGAIVDIDRKSHWTTRTNSAGYYSLSGDLKKVLAYVNGVQVVHEIRCWAPGYKISKTTRTFSIGAGVNNNVSFILYPDNEPPSAPVKLNAQPRDRAVMLSWQENTEEDFQSYLIYRSTQPIPDGSFPKPIFEVFKPFYYDSDLDNGLINGVTYYYRVCAVDRNGNKSQFSEQVAVVPRAVKVKFWLDTRDSGLLVSSAAIAGGALTFSKNYFEPVPLYSNGNGTFERVFEFDDSTFLEYKYVIYTTTGSVVWEDFGEVIYDYGYDGNWPEPANRGELMRDDLPDIEIIDEGNGEMILADKWNIPYDVAPSTPVGVNVVPGPNMLTVRWTKNLEPDLAYYTIYRMPAGGSWSEIARVNKDAVSYVDINLINNVTYYYKITATDRRGNTSGESSIVYDFPRDVDTQAPSQPQGLVAYGAGEKGLTAIKIKWEPNTEGDLAGYNLYRSTVSGFTPNLSNKLNFTLISPAVNYYVDPDITTGVTYYYKLVAVDSSGNASTPSQELVAKLVPVTFEIDMGNIYTTDVRIMGNVEPLDWAGSIKLTYISGSSWSVTVGLISGTTVQYKYKFIRGDVWVIEQDFDTASRNREYIIPFSTATKYDDWEENPLPVSNVKVYPGVYCAYLYWDKNSTAEDLLGYNVYRSVPPSTTPTLKVNPSVLSYIQPYTVTDLVPNITYYFLIKSVDAGSVQLESTTGTVVSIFITSPVYVNFGVPYHVGESSSPWGDPDRIKMYIAIQSSADVSSWSTPDRANVTNGLLEMTAAGDGTYRVTVPMLPSKDPYNFIFFAKTTDNPPNGLAPNTEYYDTVPNTGTVKEFSVYSSSTGAAPPLGVSVYFNPAGPNHDARRFLYLPPTLTPGTTLYVFANFGSTPTAPTYIQAVPGDQKVTLYWSAPYGSAWVYPQPELIGNIPLGVGESMKAVDVICGGVYQIYMTTYNPGDFSSYVSTVTVPGDTFSYTFSGLINGVTYYFLLRSSDTFRGNFVMNNYSVFSATVSAVPTPVTVTVKILVNSGVRYPFSKFKKTIVFQEGVTVSCWDAVGRSNKTPTGRAVEMVPSEHDPENEVEFSVSLVPGTTYNFLLFAYSTFSVTGLYKGTTYYDTVPNDNTAAGMIVTTSTSTVSPPAGVKVWCGNVGSTGDARRLIYIPGDISSGTTIYVYCNFGSSPTAIVAHADPYYDEETGKSAVQLWWVPYGNWGTSGESVKAVDVIAGGWYYIYRSTISQWGPWTLWFSTSGTNMYYFDDDRETPGDNLGLVPGKWYYYVIVSSDAYTGSGSTSVVSIVNMYRPGAPYFSSPDASVQIGVGVPTYFKVENNLINSSVVAVYIENKKSRTGQVR